MTETKKVDPDGSTLLSAHKTTKRATHPGATSLPFLSCSLFACQNFIPYPFVTDKVFHYDVGHMALEIIDDAIWKCVGPQPGPIVCVLGGTHGNETTGIELIHRLVAQVQEDRLSLSCGTLYLILGNPKAIERNTRGSDDHLDLNRQFTPTVLTRAADGTYEVERAKVLAPILMQADISIDVHATNKPSVPMICGSGTPRHLDVFQWFDCQNVLSDPHYVLGGQQVTTDEFVDANGGVGMCYESGQITDLSRVDQVMESVMNVLRSQKMLMDGKEPNPRYPEKVFYDLDRLIPLTAKGFQFAPNKGLQSFESFLEGDIIGFIGETPLTAPYDGVLMFPKIAEYWKIGAPVCYFAKKKL